MPILLGLVLLKTKIQGILQKQKHAARITFHANRLDHARPLLKEMKALNVYHINLIQTRKISQNSFYYKRSACKTTSFGITLRALTICNSFLSQHEKSIPHLLSFFKTN